MYRPVAAQPPAPQSTPKRAENCRKLPTPPAGMGGWLAVQWVPDPEISSGSRFLPLSSKSPTARQAVAEQAMACRKPAMADWLLAGSGAVVAFQLVPDPETSIVSSRFWLT